jgi:hypothetical protein
MPPVNHAVILASGAVVVVSAAVAAAIAIYDSPDFRRLTEDVRRRIALAVQSVSNGVQGEPRFNRPEDADGFLRSRGLAGADPGVDADDESKRRQREELLYWNSMREQQQEKGTGSRDDEKSASELRRTQMSRRGSSFDDFLTKDENAEEGTYVFNTGAEANTTRDGLRRRGVYANPFADENGIGNEEIEELMTDHLAPRKDEIMSDIYSATTREDAEVVEAVPEQSMVNIGTLIDVEEPVNPAPATSHTESSNTLERELPDDEYMVAGQEDGNEAYASIQAWAQESSRDFYSPLPVTPAEPMSEGELVSDGELTPTDSASLVGSGEDLANDVLSSRDGENGRIYDVMSESEGMATPASWSEVGSQISESDAPVPRVPA